MKHEIPDAHFSPFFVILSEKLIMFNTEIKWF